MSEQYVKQTVKVTETETTRTTETTWVLPQPVADTLNNLGFLLESGTRLMDEQRKLLTEGGNVDSLRRELAEMKKRVAQQEQTIRDLRKSKNYSQRQQWTEGRKEQRTGSSVGAVETTQTPTTSSEQPAKKEEAVDNVKKNNARRGDRINSQLRDQLVTVSNMRPADAG